MPTLTPGAVRANGVDFHYLEAGRGPLVLCLHGFPDNAFTFRSLLSALADRGFHGVAPFMRGYAPTGPASDGRYDRLSLARDPLALIEALGEHSGSLVGSDWGAVAAYGAAALAPQAVRRLVTLGVPHPNASWPLTRSGYDAIKSTWHLWFFQMPGAEDAVAADDFDFIVRWWRDASPGYEPSAQELDEVKASFRVPGVVDCAIRYYRELVSGEPTAMREAESVYARPTQPPTLAFFGSRDRPGLLELFERMDFCFTGGLEKVVVPGAGHFLHREAAAVVNDRIVGFLTSAT